MSGKKNRQGEERARTRKRHTRRKDIPGQGAITGGSQGHAAVAVNGGRRGRAVKGGQAVGVVKVKASSGGRQGASAGGWSRGAGSGGGQRGQARAGGEGGADSGGGQGKAVAVVKGGRHRWAHKADKLLAAVYRLQLYVSPRAPRPRRRGA